MNTCVTISDERYRAFIENINDGVYELDGNANFTYFNDSLSKILGYPRDEIQWQNLAKFMEEKQARVAHNSFIRIWVTRKGFPDLVWEIIQKNGQVRIIELSAYLIVNENGKKEGFRGIVRDITEKINSKAALQEIGRASCRERV